MNTSNAQHLQADFTLLSSDEINLILAAETEADEIEASVIGIATPRPGQPQAEIDAYLYFHRADKSKGIGRYVRELYKSRPDSSDDSAGWGAWYDSLTDYQRELLAMRRRANERAAREEKKGAPLRHYVTGRTDDEKRAIKTAQKRKERAGTNATPRADLSRMTDEQRAEHKREQARLRQQRRRAKADPAPRATIC